MPLPLKKKKKKKPRLTHEVRVMRLVFNKSFKTLAWRRRTTPRHATFSVIFSLKWLKSLLFTTPSLSLKFQKSINPKPRSLSQMFSPGTKRGNLSSKRERNVVQKTLLPKIESPITPQRRPLIDNSVPDRPSTGTPAPWAPRLSVFARFPQQLLLLLPLF